MILRFLLLAIALPMTGLNGQTSLRDEVKNREARSENRSPQKNDLSDRLKRMHEEKSHRRPYASHRTSYPWMVALDDEHDSSFSPHSGSRSFHQRVGDSVGIEWINGYASTLIPSLDYASAIATDESGNIYVTGYSTSPFGFRDYATIKYSGRDVKWVDAYDGPIADEDIANAITVDGDGNVYVTGTSYGGWTRMDYATVMYDANGVEKWRARYDGAGHEDDVAVAIVVDEAGNSYVTGYSGQGEGSPNDFVTIKYGHDGTELWVARYDGPIHGDDFANAIALDGSGDVYVGGGSSLDSDFHKSTLVKYGSDGIQDWVAIYSGPLVGSGAINAMAVDSAGFVYVTGQLAEWVATIKYSAGGNLIWARPFTDYPEHYVHLPTSIAVDHAGNVFVGGGGLHTTTQWNFLTIMYDSSGTQQWVARYDGPAHADDGINALTIDNFGGVYVTGLSNGIGADFATIKYDYDGNALWTRRFSGVGGGTDFANGIAFVPALASVYVTGVARGLDSTGYDFHTERYLLLDGSTSESLQHDGPGESNDLVGGISVDSKDNIYIAVSSCGSSNCFGYVLSYDSHGGLRWKTEVPGATRTKGLACDSQENILLYGTGVLTKLAPEGNVIWNAPVMAGRWCSSWEKLFAVDAQDNTFMAGPIDSKMFLSKYDSSGGLEWHVTYPDSGNDWICPAAVVADNVGGAVVTGTLNGGGGITTVKFDANGSVQWACSYRGMYGNSEGARDIAIDLEGSAYVAGYSSGVMGSAPTVLKYDMSGTLLWAVRDSLLGSGGMAIRIGLDQLGCAYITGTTECASGYADFVTAKYDANGIRMWSNCYSGTGQDIEYPVAINVSANGEVTITGYVTSANGKQYATLRYSTTGDQQWVALYERSWYNEPKGLALDRQGNVIVTGYSQVGHSFNGAGFVVTTIKYSTGSSTHTSGEVRGPSIAVDLAQNYPNPFNPSTRIEYQLPLKEFVSLKVFDVLGREVAVLVNEVQSPGTHVAEFSGAGLASGVYFYRLESGGFVETKRLVLLR